MKKSEFKHKNKLEANQCFEYFRDLGAFALKLCLLYVQISFVFQGSCSCVISGCQWTETTVP